MTIPLLVEQDMVEWSVGVVGMFVAAVVVVVMVMVVAVAVYLCLL